MHPLYAKADALSGYVIGAAIEVHRDKGPGLIESIYERCLMHELFLRRHSAVNQKIIQITYRDLSFEEPVRFDVLWRIASLLKQSPLSEFFPSTRLNS